MKLLNVVTTASVICLSLLYIREKDRNEALWKATEHELNMLWAEVNESKYGSEEAIRSEGLYLD